VGLEMKIPYLTVFLSYIFNKFKSWLNLLNQEGTEKENQEDEAQAVQDEQTLAEESDEAADDIDHQIDINSKKG
jgi:Sec-independent protein translocase protein TatA